MTIKYLSVTDVAKRLGISTAAVSAYKLPQPDALIGRTPGCQRPSTNGTRNAPDAESAVAGRASIRRSDVRPGAHPRAPGRFCCWRLDVVSLGSMGGTVPCSGI